MWLNVRIFWEKSIYWRSSASPSNSLRGINPTYFSMSFKIVSELVGRGPVSPAENYPAGLILGLKSNPKINWDYFFITWNRRVWDFVGEERFNWD
jgi:hypothetical protein